METSNRKKILKTAQNFKEMGFRIMATGGTKDFLEANDIQALFINKLDEHRPNIIDAIVNGHTDLVINTPAGKQSEYDDSYITTTAAAFAATQGIRERRNGRCPMKTLQEYHQGIGKERHICMSVLCCRFIE